MQKSVKENAAWDEDKITGKTKQELQRLRVPSIERSKMSFSGNERNHLFMNKQGESFSDVSSLSGLDEIADSRSFAIWDFDRDGLQDIVLANVNSPVLRLYRNQLGDHSDETADTGNFVAFRFVGGNKTSSHSTEFSNRDGIGAKVVLSFDEYSTVRENRCGEGLAAQNTKVIHFGIGNQDVVPAVQVQWPSGKQQKIESIPAGKLVTVFENPAESPDESGFLVADYKLAKQPPRREAEEYQKDIFATGQATGSGLRLYVSFASWCDNCKKHLTQIELLRNHFDEDALELIAVPIDSNDVASVLADYQEKFKPAFKPIGPWTPKNSNGFNKLIREHLNCDLFPASIITDGKGTVLKAFAGVPTISEVIEARSLGK